MRAQQAPPSAPTPESCRAQAEEAERMAAVVSYGRDRERLLEQAAGWRARAAELEAAAAQAPSAGASRASGLLRRLKALLRPGRSRGG